jgi:flagellar hook-basal body complex protein FliE
MSAVPPQAVGAIDGAAMLSALSGPAASAAATPQGASFAQVLMNGVEAVNHRVASADAMVRAFAVDDSIPLHQVTFALEEARLSVEMMMQVRARLVESYQRMMEMQL